MPKLNSEHLVEQAERLVRSAGSGKPRQADLRRAISSAYYGVFHAVLSAAADYSIGQTKRNTAPYSLAYRSINHSTLRDLCTKVKNWRSGGKLAYFVPGGDFGTDLRKFAVAAVDLMEKRHLADYDPLYCARLADTNFVITIARAALQSLKAVPQNKREAFLSLLLFPLR